MESITILKWKGHALLTQENYGKIPSDKFVTHITKFDFSFDYENTTNIYFDKRLLLLYVLFLR